MAGSLVRFKLNSAGMRELLNSGEVGGFMMTRANRVAAAARSSAPVLTGAYRNSITTQLARTDRAVGRVIASAPHAMLVEANTRNLGRSVDAAG